ncbi:hypothetical protein BN871_AM_00280 [Paenibacillus sp. P22]|nr:hypothetical protein BN871_AM_00280 [Paenibacillus sp. P22]
MQKLPSCAKDIIEKARLRFRHESTSGLYLQIMGPSIAVSHSGSTITRIACPAGRLLGMKNLRRCKLIVEIDDVVLVVGAAQRHRGTRMLVEQAGDHVRHDVAPFFLLAKRNHVLLDHFEHGAHFVLRIRKMRYEQLRVAVAGSAAHAVYGGVEEFHAFVDSEQRIGKSKLLIVVRMHAQLLVRQMLLEFVDQVSHVVRLEAAVRVDDVDHVDDALADGFECLDQLIFHDVRQRHDVERRLVAAFMEQGHELQCLVHILDVAGDADQIQHAVDARQNIRFVHSADVHERGQLRIPFVRDDFAQEVIVQEAPRTGRVGTLEQLGRILVANLHIFNAGLIQAAIQILHKLNAEIPVIDKTSITDRAVDDFADAVFGRHGHRTPSS